MKIIIVDDEPKICKGLVKLIGSFNDNWEIVGAYQEAISALKHIKKADIDVLLTDIKMPEVSGLDLIYRVKEINSNINIVILSGYSNFSYAQQAIEMGVYRYLTKPTKPNELISVLKAIEKEIVVTPSDRGREEEIVANQIVNKAIEHIERNYYKKLTLSSICNELYITPTYFCELFKKYTTKTFIEYLSEYRISKAKELLVDPRNNIKEIADLVGINDARYFSVIFKKNVGMTPSEYRNQHPNI